MSRDQNKKGNAAAQNASVTKTSIKRRLRYGGYATVISIILIAVVLTANVVVKSLEDKYGWRADLTKNQMYSLSDQSVQVLNELGEDISLFYCYQDGAHDNMVKEVANRYQAQSSHIKLEEIDPVKDPARLFKYTDNGSVNISSGAVIVSNADGSKFRILSTYDLYNVAANSAGTGYDIVGLQAEAKITGALNYITDEYTPKVYFLTGHSETEISNLGRVTSALLDENYEPLTINLKLDSQKLEKGDTLVVVSPKIELEDDEREKIRTFLRTGGKMIICYDPMQRSLESFESLMELYGVTVENDLVYETNTSHYISSPVNLVPVMHNHTINNPITGASRLVLIPRARSFNLPTTELVGVTVTKLLSSSNDAYGKTNLESITGAKEEGDLDGPLTVALTIEYRDLDNPNNDAKIVAFGTSVFLEALDNAANRDLFMNSINWLKDKEAPSTIRAKSLSADQMEITGAQMNTIAAIVVIVVPLVLFAAGLTVWLRRRHL